LLWEDVRYEDDTTMAGRPFSAGVTLNKLHGKSTDEKWEPSLSSSAQSKFIFKLLQLQDLSVYWNPDDQFLTWKTLEELAAAMQRLIPKPTDPSTKVEQKSISHNCMRST
jgi:vacuolar protein sorting-associated protein 13A/C